MRILNLTTTNHMISVSSTVDITIKAKSLSREFQCTPRVLSGLVQAPNYQNKFRFVMDPQERIMTNEIPVLDEVIISNSEAEEMAKKLEHGIDPVKKMDIMGNEVPEEDQGKKIDDFDFDHHRVKVSLKNPKATKMPTLLNQAAHPVTYSSSDEKVATVDENGKVKFLEKGKTTITAVGAKTEEFIEAQASYELEVTK